ncbi:MAG: hypothetical protein HZT43_17845 [Exiguobacterium profundum]|nr:MAG: hypothetical protein HZT43_17845 [Exiguobacterium profundum]
MTLTHHQLPARSGQTRSLVVLLHGFGSNGQAMLGLGRTLSTALPDTTFLAPDAPDAAPGRPGGRMWYTIPELGGSSTEEADLRLQASARKLDTYLDDQLAAHGLPAAAMALLGFSQGAGMAYEVAPRRRDQLVGVIAIEPHEAKGHARHRGSQHATFPDPDRCRGPPASHRRNHPDRRCPVRRQHPRPPRPHGRHRTHHLGRRHQRRRRISATRSAAVIRPW